MEEGDDFTGVIIKTCKIITTNSNTREMINYIKFNIKTEKNNAYPCSITPAAYETLVHAAPWDHTYLPTSHLLIGYNVTLITGSQLGTKSKC